MALTGRENRAVSRQNLSTRLELQALSQSVTNDTVLPGVVILYLLTIVIPIGVSLGPLALTGLRGLLLVMVLPMLVRLFSGQYGRVFVTDILFLLHVLWATLALAVNSPSQVIQQTGSVGVEFIGGYLLGRAYIRGSAEFLTLCKWLVFLVLCTTPFALLEAKTGQPLIIAVLQKIPGLTTVPIITYDRRMGLERVQAVFAHPIHYGLFCSVVFSLAFVALRGTTSTLRRYVSSILVAASGFLALSSGALLAIILQIALILWASLFARMRQRWWLLFGLFILAYIVIDILSNRTPLQVFMTYATFSAHNAYARSIIFDWGMKNLWGSPVFGLGLRDWMRLPWMSSSMDNFWLLTAVRYGIPGFVFLVAGYVWAIFLIMRRNFNTDPSLMLIRRAWVFAFLGLTFTLTTVHVWTNIYSFVFFMFGAGMWMIKTPAADLTSDKVPEPRSQLAPDTGLTEQTTLTQSYRSQPAYSRFDTKKHRQGPPSGPSA